MIPIWRFVIFGVILTLISGQGAIERFPTYKFPSNIATLDRAQLYRLSDFGRQQLVEINKLSDALRTENSEVSAELEKEEEALTETRKTATQEEFSKLASDFDAKVKQTRALQAQKSRQLVERAQAAEQKFWSEAEPILRELMADFGIIFILDRSTVIVATQDGDLTQDALIRINAALSGE